MFFYFMKNLKELFLIFLRGLFMGTADAIPGVSGGTIALITGIYQRLIHAINEVNTLLVKELFNLNFKKFFKNFKKIDFALLIPLLSGIVLALLILSHLIDYLLSAWTAITYAFFLGLILSSAIFVYRQAGRNHNKNFLFFAIGLFFAFWFVGLKTLETNHSLLVLLFSGAIAICAMILPGISGAFILVLLNQYEFLINVIKNLMFDKIAVFVLGALIGILSFSRFLDFLLKKHKPATMSFLTGLMIGSLRLPYKKIVSSYNNLLLVVFIGLIGFFLVFILEKKFNHK